MKSVRYKTLTSANFSLFIERLLTLLSFEVQREPKLPHWEQLYQPNFLISQKHLIAICDIKFYRSRIVHSELILQAAQNLAFVSNATGFKYLLVVSSIVDPTTKEKVSNLGIVLWDRSNIANFLLAINRYDLLEEFGLIITESQQGTDTSLPFESIDEDTIRDPLSYFNRSEPTIALPLSISTGKRLIAELNNIPSGKEGWAGFETKCIEILEYLFEKDLTLWDKQTRTDDGISRFDLICRIVPTDDFWRTLVQSFNSRYVLFEFKNYNDGLPAGQIYTTERYLYPKALRGTSIVIARNGATGSALAAAKGALRESGKLLLIISENDLKEMLTLKDKGDSPSDFLSGKLDEHLISLSR